MTETENAHDTPRHRMLESLNDDLFFGAWDEPNKMWFMLGQPGDEYLEYVGGFNMEPSHWLLHRVDEGELAPHVTGVAIAYECWAYPAALGAIFDEHPNLRDAYVGLVPPNRHPDHTQLRSIVLATRDGEVLRCDKHEDDGRVEWMNLLEDNEQGEPVPPPPTGPVGNPEVDYMRTLMGINPLAENPVAELAGYVYHSHAMRRILAEAKQQNWDEDRTTAEIYWCAPEELRHRLDRVMKDSVRAYINEHPEIAHEHGHDE